MDDDTFPKTVTLIGFLALGIGIISAYRNPATGFELSIYTSTPLLFWICSCFAVFGSVLVVFSNTDKQTLLAGGFLGGLSMTTIAALPIIRGYHYLGQEDSLSHLGTTVDLNAGLLLMTENRYPAVHTLGSVLHDATGLPLTHMLILLVVVFIVTFFAFIPLAVRQLTGDTTMTYIGLFSGLLLLPLNHLSPSTIIHPTSQAIMFAPAFLLVFFMLYRHRTLRRSLLFLVTAAAFVLIHPQQAANMVLFVGTVSVVQVGSHLYRGDGWSRRDEWVLPEAFVFAGLFWLWVQNLELFWRNLGKVLQVPFTRTTVAETTVSRTLSLEAVGGSLPEVFMKLFFVSTLFAVLTASLMAVELFRGRIDLQSLRPSERTTPDGGTPRANFDYVFYGLLAVGAIFLLYLIGSISDQYFRHLGMLMVFASILGSIALGRGVRHISTRHSAPAGRLAITSFLLVCLVLTVPVVFPSPYIYDSSIQVTEAQMEGYGTTFEYQSDAVAFSDIRSSTSRYGHAIQGRDVPTEAYYREPPADRGVPDHFADRDLPGYYEEPTYVPVTDADRKRDPILWNGFRFSQADFEYLDAEPGVNRVQTNGGYDLYLVSE